MRDGNKATEIEERLIDFAVRVIEVADALPKTPVGKHIAGQLLRSGTSPASNDAEARGAESNAVFVHKLKSALKKLNESSVRLRMTCRAELMKTESLDDLIDETSSLAESSTHRLRQPNENNWLSATSDRAPGDK